MSVSVVIVPGSWAHLASRKRTSHKIAYSSEVLVGTGCGLSWRKDSAISDTGINELEINKCRKCAASHPIL